MSLRDRIGATNHDEYVQAVARAGTHGQQALAASDPATARREIALAREELARADTRLAAHAAPPS